MRPPHLLRLRSKSASVYQRTCSGNRKFWTSDGLCGSNLAVCFTPVVVQFTAFDGVIIAASMSSCAARRSSLMLWALQKCRLLPVTIAVEKTQSFQGHDHSGETQEFCREGLPSNPVPLLLEPLSGLRSYAHLLFSR